MDSKMVFEPLSISDAGQVIDMWNRALVEEPAGEGWHWKDHWLSEQKMEEMLRKPNYDPEGSLVCKVKGRVVGYGRAVIKRIPAYEGDTIEEKPAFLEGFVVEQQWRGRGIGKQLLEKLEAYAHASGKQTIQTACWHSPVANFYLLPGSSGHRFLIRRGYEEVSPEMRLRLRFDEFTLRQEILDKKSQLESEGIEIKHCDEAHREAFAELARTQFDSWWYLVFRPNLESTNPRPVLVAVEDDRVAGFIGLADVNENGTADFVLGVSSDYRRRGIAAVLVNVWASEMKAKGAVESQIDTGVSNPAQQVYFAAGYKKLGEFPVHMSKNLA